MWGQLSRAGRCDAFFVPIHVWTEQGSSRTGDGRKLLVERGVQLLRQERLVSRIQKHTNTIEIDHS